MVSFTLSYTGARDDTVADVTNAHRDVLRVAERPHAVRRKRPADREFLKAQLDDAKKQLESRTKRRCAAYTGQHPSGELPQQVDVNLARLDRLNTQLRMNGERQLDDPRTSARSSPRTRRMSIRRTGETTPLSDPTAIGSSG